MTACDFQYDIGETVQILPLGLSGMIAQRCDRGAGQHDYQVIFWSDAKRSVEWLMPHELGAA